MSTYEATNGAHAGTRNEPRPQGPAPAVAAQQEPRQEVRTAPSRRDRIRWGCVIGGLTVALSTYLLLQLGLSLIHI